MTSAAAQPVKALRGIILRDDHDTLVVRATPEEVSHFTRGDRVTMSGVHPAAEDAVFNLRPGERLYDSRGREVLEVHDLSITMDHIDITSFGDSTSRYMRGGMRVSIEGRVLAR